MALSRLAVHIIVEDMSPQKRRSQKGGTACGMQWKPQCHNGESIYQIPASLSIREGGSHYLSVSEIFVDNFLHVHNSTLLC